VALVHRQLAETRERAQSLILAGAVRVDGQAATRPAQPVADGASIEVDDPLDRRFASRGALKLQAALDYWHVDPAGKVALDIGASTGGFTDLLLQRGASRVYAVDVGYGQLHYRLRTDPRVVVMERTNVRHLESLPERPTLTVADVSFISLRLALPPVFRLVDDSADMITLIKPQFEAGRGQVGKGGVVRDPAIHRQVLATLASWSADQPWQLTDAIPSPIRGPAGNVELLGRWERDRPPLDTAVVERVIADSAAVARGTG
jgi:23S rRNA (cytidine1920-2'-O)/16S rRNA (cytidine1409-2'-O)-methyltransferase